MSLIALSDHLSLQDFQSGEQRGRSVALIVMRHGSATALFQRQARLGAIQRLNLTLFIHAEHNRLLRRIQIEAHHIGQLLQELGIPRQLESFHPMRFEIVTPPDVVDGGLADSLKTSWPAWRTSSMEVAPPWASRRVKR